MERKVIKAEVGCDMCGNLGFSMFEDPCEACDGEGRVMKEIYEDCRCDIEDCDCFQDVEIQHVEVKVA